MLMKYNLQKNAKLQNENVLVICVTKTATKSYNQAPTKASKITSHEQIPPQQHKNVRSKY